MDLCAIGISRRSTNERTKGHKLDEGIEADRCADDGPSRRKGKGNDALLPQRRVSIHDTGEKGPAQTGERRRYLWVGENGLPGAELRWHVACHVPVLQGVAQRTKPTSQRVRRLVWYSYIFMLLLCTSFLFRKLLGVALLAAGKKMRCFPHGRFHRSQNCGSRIRGYPRQVVLWICTEIAAGYSGEIPFSRPRVTWVARRQPSSSRQKLFFPKFNRQGLHVSPEHRVPDRLNCASWGRVPHLRP